MALKTLAALTFLFSFSQALAGVKCRGDLPVFVQTKTSTERFLVFKSHMTAAPEGTKLLIGPKPSKPWLLYHLNDGIVQEFKQNRDGSIIFTYVDRDDSNFFVSVTGKKTKTELILECLVDQ